MIRELAKVARAGVALAAITTTLGAQSWLAPGGKAYGGWVRSSSGEQWVAAATLPGDGSVGTSESSGSVVTGSLSTGMSTSVTSGMVGADRAGVQSVASVTNVNILSGRITASRVFAIAMISQDRNRSIAEGDGSAIEGLTVNGVAMGTPAANTRVELPGVGYAILNEQISGKGRGATFTVNMIHVYMTNGGEIIVGSAMTTTGS